MHFTFSDVVGTIGSITLIIAFFLLQVNLLKSDSYAYLWMNFSGALLILFFLFYTTNKASVIIEVFWISISIYGLVKKRITNNYEDSSPRL